MTGRSTQGRCDHPASIAAGTDHYQTGLNKTALIWLLLLPATLCGQADRKTPALRDAADGTIWSEPESAIRVRFVRQDRGFDVVFEALGEGGWTAVAALPPEAAWAVYDKWDDPPNSELAHWFGGRHVFPVMQVRGAGENEVVATGRGEVDGQPWDFQDRYRFEHGAVRIDRRWHHAGSHEQRKITLTTALRVPAGSDPRVMLPGILYNGNPSAYAAKPVFKMPYVPGARALYEEHRFPVPFVNIESSVSDRRVYASLLTVPSRVPEGHKDDQWWSLGLEWRWDGHVDLLSTSGAVATNGFPSMVYGHRNGFDPYDDAYIDVTGDTTIEKTYYVDCGLAPRVGYSFRQTVWKAFDVFRPTETPHLPLQQAARLKVQRVNEVYRQSSDGVAGIPLLPEFPRFMYGWVGDNLATAYGMLDYAERTGDVLSRERALRIVDFYVKNCRAQIPGLLSGDYDVKTRRWLGSFYQGWDWPDSISSRQLGEILDRLGDLVFWAKEHSFANQSEWRRVLVEGGNFASTTRRYKGLFPRSWSPDGSAIGWGGEAPASGTITTSGAYLISPLAKLYRLSGDQRYLNTAESAMRAYYERYGQDLSRPYWGATLDAGSEDKEAGAGVLHGALALYEATRNQKYLDWARDAADWLMTWIYMYDVDLPSSAPMHGILHTVGWTVISVQNQEIDNWGAFLAPDFYQLGTELNDKRYSAIARNLFQAQTQTIVRPGAMQGKTHVGSQPEHCNQTNTTHVRNGGWRGTCWTYDISWVYAATLYNAAKMLELGAFEW